MITRWEHWYNPIRVKIENEKGKILNAETEIISTFDFKKQKPIENKKYPFFLNTKGDMLSLAKKDRESFLKDNG